MEAGGAVEEATSFPGAALLLEESSRANCSRQTPATRLRELQGDVGGRGRASLGGEEVEKSEAEVASPGRRR